MTMVRKFLAVAVAAGLLVFAAGCSETSRFAGGGTRAFDSDTAESIFQKAERQRRSGNLITASELYQEIDRRFPFSPLAIRAQILTIFSLYRAERYDESLTAIDRFVQLHPGNKDVPYALYLRGLNHYDQISDVGRDQGQTLKAREAFEELIRRYPDSAYAKDAKVKIDLTIDQLAGKEMDVGRFYLNDRHYLAAINRFRTVVEDYQETAHVQEALYRLTEAYLSMGVAQEAQAAAAVLGFNYPRSRWYNKAFRLLRGQNLQPAARNSSWLSRAFGRGQS